jgi:RecA-family ATPase
LEAEIMTIQYPNIANESSVSVALFDRAAILSHFSQLHNAAKRANVLGGKVVLAVFGQNPDTIENVAEVRHFEIGDVEGMTNAAMEFDGVPHRNVYNPLVVLKQETPAGSRKEADIAAVLGFVVDGDADKGKDAPTSPLPADYIIESSAGNLQYFLWLDQPLPAAEAKPLAVALKRATGADGANDIVHVWRVPGCLNWPNAAKVKRGRSRVPDPVRVKWPWSKWTTVNDLRTVLQPHWEKPRAQRTATAAATGTRAEPSKVDGVPKVGNYDLAETASLLTWMTENKMFDEYEDWFQCGMALKTEFGADGFALWGLTHNATVLPGLAETKWNSFDREPEPGCVTLKSLLWRAREMGWEGNVRNSSAYMFRDVVAQLAANAGATLPPPLTPEEQAKMAADWEAGARPGPSSDYGWGDEEEDEIAATEIDEIVRARRFDAASLEGKTPPVMDWVVRGLIPAGNVTLLYGDGGTGKSLLTLQLAVALAGSSMFFFGIPIENGGVEFVTAEDSKDELHRRLFEVCKGVAVKVGDLSCLHITSLVDADATLATAGRDDVLTETPLYRKIERILKETRPRLLALDTLADTFGGNEIVRAQARRFITMLRHLALKYNCAILVLAHPSLDGIRSGKGTSGSTAWNNSVRSRLYFKRVEDETGREEDEDARILEVAKANYGRKGLNIPMRWERGLFVPVRKAGGGDDPLVAATNAKTVFLDLLAKHRANNSFVSMDQSSPPYVPKIFGPEAKKRGISRLDLIDAMHLLLDEKKIENAPHGMASKKVFRLYAT